MNHNATNAAAIFTKLTPNYSPGVDETKDHYHGLAFLAKGMIELDERLEKIDATLGEIQGGMSRLQNLWPG